MSFSINIQCDVALDIFNEKITCNNIIIYISSIMGDNYGFI